MKRDYAGWLIAVTLFVMSTFSNVHGAAQEATPVADYPQETLDAIQLILQDADAGLMPGVVVYVDSPRGQILESAGVADIESGTPIDPNAPFQIGSNTKMMTAAMVLQLQEEGLLDVDDLLSVHMPDITALFPGGDQITIRMLLNHTSGLYDVVEDMAAAIFTTWERTGSTVALEQQWTQQEAIDYTARYRARASYFAPGAEGQWHYTNTGYFVLGVLIEQLTGKSFRDNLQDRILDPLGMTSTSYAEGIWEGETRGYYQTPFDFDTSTWNLSQGAAAGAVVSTPQDLAVFMRALLGGELFKNEETLDLMQSTVEAQPLLASYGLGLIDFGSGVWGHGGQTLGFSSRVFYNIETDTVVVAWTNTSSPASQSFALMQFSVASF